MMPITRLVGIFLLALASVSAASERPFTGAFKSWGRACNGGVYVRAKTIEWISSWSICKPSPYEVLDRSAADEPERIAFHIKQRSKTCLYEVVELVNNEGSWFAIGYQTLEAFRNRNDPEWRDSPLPERWTLACPMERRG